jgi:serine protease AprX
MAVSAVIFQTNGFSQIPSNISPELAAAGNSQVNVIVQYAHGAGAGKHQLATLLGAAWKKDMKSVKAASYSIPAANLQSLANDPDVTYISPDRQVHMTLDNTAGAVNAAAAWSSGLDGTGIGVAVIDSGISQHDDLQGRVVYSQDFTGGDASDQYGHGEHVAGIIGGNGTDSNCTTCSRHLVGIAPNVNLIDLRVLDQNGQGSDSQVIAALETAIDLAPVYNIRVINLSLGRPVYESYTLDPLCQAVEAAWQAGIVVVVAAGNDGRNNFSNNNGYGTINAPGNDPYIITVGAMKSMGTPSRTDDLIATYSSKGPAIVDHVVKPDLVAPGNQVVSLLSGNSTLAAQFPQNFVPLSYYQWSGSSQPSTSYFTLSGTSMATPVVSGAVALMLQAQPKLTPDQVKARLMRTAYKTFPATSTATDLVTGQTYTSQYDVFTVGAGYLDIAAALADNTPFWGAALSPTATNGNDDNTSSTQISCGLASVCAQQAWGNCAPWSAQAIWGAQAIGGDLSIFGNQSIWSDQSIWSEQSIWAEQSIWSEQSVSGTQSIWSETLKSQSIGIAGEN